MLQAPSDDRDIPTALHSHVIDGGDGERPPVRMRRRHGQAGDQHGLLREAGARSVCACSRTGCRSTG